MLSGIAIAQTKNVPSIYGEKLLYNDPAPANWIPFAPMGNVTSSNVQAALNELDSKKAPIVNPAFSVNRSGGFSITSNKNPVANSLMIGMQPNMTTNSYSLFKFGQSQTAKNCGDIIFDYIGPGSIDNSWRFGLNSVNNFFRITAGAQAFYNNNEIATISNVTAKLKPKFGRQVGSLLNISTSTPVNTSFNVTLPQDWISNNWNLTNTAFGIRVRTFRDSVNYSDLMNVQVSTLSTTWFTVTGEVMGVGNPSGFVEIELYFEIMSGTQLAYRGMKVTLISGDFTFQKCDVYIQV